MPLTTRPRATATAVLAVGLLLGAAAPASAQHVVGDGASAAVPSQSLQRALSESVVCDLIDGLRLCSHGDDAHLAGTSTAQGGPDAAPSSTSSTRIGCYRSGPRVQAVYARPAGSADRFTTSLPSFRGWAGAVEKTVDDSAHKTGGARHVRFASTPSGDSCTLSVLRVTLPANAFASFSATVEGLRDLGLDRVGEKYLVWVDAKGYCGIASSYQDDSPGTDNVNNGRFPSYARIDRACWGRVEAHELMHMLGAVQSGAPHATLGMHCRDGADVMCYDDGTRGSRQTAVCPGTHSRLLDCRGDDYFSTSPPAGSWLARHWNTAASAFLARDWTDPAPVRTASQPAPSPAGPAPRPTPSPSAKPEARPTPAGGGLLPLVLPTVLR